MVEKYRRQNSSVLIGFIDASKAFDRINHYKLLLKLSQKGMPDSVIRILVYRYTNQSMQIKWGNAVSTPFGVSNGVRKGGLLSPWLFNIYMNDPSDQLRSCKKGCVFGNTIINHLMYVDDFAIVSPSSAGFQELLNICSDYGVKFNVNYNAKKSSAMICRSKGDKDLMLPSFHLSGPVLPV